MRPPKRSQDLRRYPLNRWLGSEAHVRILRALVQAAPHPLSFRALADRTLLSRPALTRPVEALQREGIVTPVGDRGRLVVLEASHPLAAALTAMFEAERRAHAAFVAAVRDAAVAEQEAVAIWMPKPTEGSGADAPLLLWVLAPASDLDGAVRRLRTRLAPVELAHHTTLEIRALSRTEFELLGEEQIRGWQDATVLSGPHPSMLHPGSRATAPRTGAGTHQRADERALTHARYVAERLRVEPDLVERALAELQRMRRDQRAGTDDTLNEWETILRTASSVRLRRLLVDPGERMTRLRQSSPFLALVPRLEDV